MTDSISFFVPGIPRPGGSKKAFVIPKTNRAIVTDAGKYTKQWRSTCAQVAAGAMVGREILTGPLVMSLWFRFARPKSHYRTGKYADLPKGSAPDYHIIQPDTTKLVRALEDALTGIVYRDDSQVIVQHARKVYSQSPGADVEIRAYSKYD